MTKNVFDKLAVKQKFQKRVLRDYIETLDRVFQIIYELDAKVDWTGIDRCSPVSNFGIVRGSVVVPEGTKIKNIKGDYASFDERKVFDAGFMLPLSTLDKCTPYEIAEYVHQLKMLQTIATQEEFSDLINDPDFNEDNIQDYLPSDIPREVQEEDDDSELTDSEIAEIIEKNKIPEPIQGFDLTDLNDSQVERLMLNMIGDAHGTKQ